MTGEKKPLTGAQWLTLAAAFLGWMFDGVEIGMIPLVTPPALQNLLGIGGESAVAEWMGAITACFLVGAAIGGISFGWLGDKIGRVRGMVSCMLMFSLFTGACYFVTAPWQFGMCVFLAALGMGGEWSLAVALVMEVWPERHRSKLAGLIGAAANFGFLFIALVALNWQVTVDDWRWMMLVGASPAVLAILIAFFVPESERWKAAAKKGGRSPIVEIFRPGLLNKTLLAMAFSAIPLIGTWAAVSIGLPRWADKLEEAQAGRMLLPPSSHAAFDAAKTPKEKTDVLKSALSEKQWKDIRSKGAHARALVQVSLSIGAILGCFGASILGGLFGRRPVYFSLCLLSLVFCGYMFNFVGVYDLWFIIVGGVLGAVTAAFYGWLPLYLPELFPTRIRATGQGLSFNIGRVVAACGAIFLGQFVALFGDDYGRAMGTITLIYVVGLVLIWFAPETKDKPLPE